MLAPIYIKEKQEYAAVCLLCSPFKNKNSGTYFTDKYLQLNVNTQYIV